VNSRFAFGFALGLIVSSGGYASTIEGKVIRVADGDTLTILDADRVSHKIRLAGIDAPEKAQPFGQASRKQLSALCINQQATVSWKKRDKYQRIVGKVTCGSVDTSLNQINTGMAWWYTKYKDEQTEEEQQTYAAAELNARTKRLGLWQEANPIPPWEWRKKTVTREQ
jgi:endonuclease YncB( thermonuclease family)